MNGDALLAIAMTIIVTITNTIITNISSTSYLLPPAYLPPFLLSLLINSNLPSRPKFLSYQI